MTDPRTARSLRAEAAKPAGPAGIDPFAAALCESPYVVIGELAPDMPFRDLQGLNLRLQRRGLGAEDRAALREVRDLTARLVWDLQTLGTTPAVPDDRWQALGALLHAGHREEARQHWLTQAEDPVAGTAALHVCAVLSSNENAQHLAQGQTVDEEPLKRYVAFWAALLRKRDWLIAFAAHRCRVWGRPAPDRGDQTQFLDRTEKTIVGRLYAAVGDVEPQRSRWSAAWLRERATIEAVERAFAGDPRPRWAQGLGPLGLEVLGRQREAQDWIHDQARSYRGGLPLHALKAGAVRVDDRDPSGTAEAAAALRLLFSQLGDVACEVWNGRARTALDLLDGRSILETGPGLPGAADAWFGHGRGAAVRLRVAAEELKAEALLSQFQEDLTRPEVPAAQVCGTSDHGTLNRLLYLADIARRPSVLIERVEDLVIGRLSACTESKRLPQPAEVERLLEICREVRKRLLERHAGERCGSALARLLKRRAVRRWTQAGRRLPKAGVQLAVIRDLIEAVTVAPYNADLLTNLCRAAIQMDFGSAEERRNRLQTVLGYVDRCREAGSTSQELDEVWLDLLDAVDPGRAMSEAQRILREATAGAEGSRDSAGR